MEGYSVTEAASILGVPTERVWELLARGVLSGSPEGETGMRVFLQPRPAPAPPMPEATRTNGDAGTREPERELSPFRELLTEFRNLTERYGQALLALGESRGEVASLRSRVDLLEARMDLRLPMGSAAPAGGGWPTPVAAVEPGAPAAAAAQPHHDEEDEDRPRRRRGQRRATESFAEALARAEDPSRPELPGAAETAAAIAAFRDDVVPEGEHGADAVLPRELPAAEPMPLPEEPEATSADSTLEEPDAVTTADAATTLEAVDTETEAAAAFAESVAGELEGEPTSDTDVQDRGPELEIEAAAPPMVTAVEEGGGAVEPMPSPVSDGVTAESVEIASESAPEADEETSEPVLAADRAPASEADVAPGADAEGPAAAQDDAAAGEVAADEVHAAEEPAPTEADEEPPSIEAADEPAPRTAAAEEPAPAEDPEPIAGSVSTTEQGSEPEPIEWDPERYTVEIVEPDWYADEQSEAFTPASASAAPPPVEAESDAPAAAATASEPAVTSPPPSPSPSDGEETMLWFGQGPQEAPLDEGADEIESVGAAPRSAAAPVPGSQELDEALAALEALSRGIPTTPDPPSEPPADESWPPASASQDPPVAAIAATEHDSPGDTSTSPAGLLPSVRPPATSASRAYRRLRRIFPG